MRSALAALTFSVFFALSFSNADAECVKKIKVHHGCAQPTRHVAPSGADVRAITAEQIATAKKQQEIADQAIARLIQEQENLRVAKERANVEIDDRKGRVDREIAELRERTGREIAEAKQRAERDLAPAREEAAKLRQSVKRS
jgi:molecular chaperone GrpE (heat shock protein)